MKKPILSFSKFSYSFFGGISLIPKTQNPKQNRVPELLIFPHLNFVSSPDNPHQADQQTSNAQRYDEDNDVLEQTPRALLGIACSEMDLNVSASGSLCPFQGETVFSSLEVFSEVCATVVA